MRFTIGKKLGFGFGVLILLMIVSSAITYSKLKEVDEVQTRVVDQRFPTVLAGDQLLNGLNHSLAALRGYIILGSDPEKAEFFKNDRAAAWKDITEALESLHRFSKNWTVKTNLDRLEQLKAELEQFRLVQQQVEDIAQTDDNVPAYTTLLTEAAPRAAGMIKALTAVIDEEEKLEATPQRKALLKQLADCRGSLAVGIASVRAYLLSGQPPLRDDFKARWAANQEAFDRVQASRQLLTAAQKEQWDTFVKLRAEFAALPPKIWLGVAVVQ